MIVTPPPLDKTHKKGHVIRHNDPASELQKISFISKRPCYKTQFPRPTNFDIRKRKMSPGGRGGLCILAWDMIVHIGSKTCFIHLFDAPTCLSDHLFNFLTTKKVFFPPRRLRRRVKFHPLSRAWRSQKISVISKWPCYKTQFSGRARFLEK